MRKKHFSSSDSGVHTSTVTVLIICSSRKKAKYIISAHLKALLIINERCHVALMNDFGARFSWF